MVNSVSRELVLVKFAVWNLRLQLKTQCSARFTQFWLANSFQEFLPRHNPFRR